MTKSSNESPYEVVMYQSDPTELKEILVVPKAIMTELKLERMQVIGTEEFNLIAQKQIEYIVGLKNAN